MTEPITEAIVCSWCGGSRLDKPPTTCRRKETHICGKRHGKVARCELTRGECKRREEEYREERWAANPAKVPQRASDVVRGLHRHYKRPAGQNRQWTCIEELRVGTGWGESGGLRFEQRIDFYAVNVWPSRGDRFVAHEVKISRADFFSEIKNPEKCLSAFAISTEYYFATPPGLITPDELPPDCGLIEVRYGPRGGLYTEEIVPATVRSLDAFHPRTVASILRQIDDERRYR